MTISELFGKQSEYALGDSIKLICDLHKSFVKCTGLAEDLDHFYEKLFLLVVKHKQCPCPFQQTKHDQKLLGFSTLRLCRKPKELPSLMPKQHPEQ